MAKEKGLGSFLGMILFAIIACMGFDGKCNVNSFLKTIDERPVIEKCDDEHEAEVVQRLCTDAAEDFVDKNTYEDDYPYKAMCERMKRRCQEILRWSL